MLRTKETETMTLANTLEDLGLASDEPSDEFIKNAEGAARILIGMRVKDMDGDVGVIASAGWCDLRGRIALTVQYDSGRAEIAPSLRSHA